MAYRLINELGYPQLNHVTIKKNSIVIFCFKDNCYY